MNILFDIGHPAHVHLYRNAYKILGSKGHNVHIMSRDKEIARYLLDSYKIKYFKGTVQKIGSGRLLELLEWFWKLYNLIGKHKIDIVISIGSPAASWAAIFKRIPHLVFTDTESSKYQRMIFKPGAKEIFTPECFHLDLGKKQVRYSGYHELAYLHPKYFTPDKSILDLLEVEPGEKYTIMRFVSWGAMHDIGHKGITVENKVKAVNAFKKFGEVFITSEAPLPDEIAKYRIKIPPERIHDALHYASLLYGESATMASECSILGTPSIYLDDVGRGYTDEQQEKYGTVFNYTESLEDQEASIEKGKEILSSEGIKPLWKQKQEILLKDTIDLTEFMVKEIEKYQ